MAPSLPSRRGAVHAGTFAAGSAAIENRAVTPRLYAHRGACAELPENTLPSFARALELGADALELDVHGTADGHVVVSHDPSAERMCGVAAAYRSARLDEIRRLDAGAGFLAADGGRPFRGRGLRVPTLEELLVEFPDVVLNIDITQSRPAIAGRVVELVRRHRAEDRVILASFQLRTMLRVRAAGYPGVTALSQPELALLRFAPAALTRSFPLRGQAAQLPTRRGRIDFSLRWLIDKCHQLGLRVDYWTVNDPDEARFLLDLGADGIMTDDPAAIAPVFAAPGRR
jgi:glycerophosphoryl diester phosphodiesterase